MKADLPVAEFPFALSLTAAGDGWREYSYCPLRAAAPFLLALFLWYAVLLLLDRSAGNLLPVLLDWCGASERAVDGIGFWLVRHRHLTQALYLLGGFWAVAAGSCWLPRGRLRVNFDRNRIVCILGRGRKAVRSWARLRAVEEVVLVDGRGMFLWCGDDFACLRLAVLGRGVSRRREYALELSRQIGCAWSHADRRGRVLGHLACP